MRDVVAHELLLWSFAMAICYGRVQHICSTWKKKKRSKHLLDEGPRKQTTENE
jgi:hypothetical protein